MPNSDLFGFSPSRVFVLPEKKVIWPTFGRSIFLGSPQSQRSHRLLSPLSLSLCLWGVAGEQMIISPAPPPHLFPSLPFSMSQLHLFYSINELASHLWPYQMLIFRYWRLWGMRSKVEKSLLWPTTPSISTTPLASCRWGWDERREGSSLMPKIQGVRKTTVIVMYALSLL